MDAKISHFSELSNFWVRNHLSSNDLPVVVGQIQTQSVAPVNILRQLLTGLQSQQRYVPLQNKTVICYFCGRWRENREKSEVPPRKTNCELWTFRQSLTDCLCSVTWRRPPWVSSSGLVSSFIHYSLFILILITLAIILKNQTRRAQKKPFRYGRACKEGGS